MFSPQDFALHQLFGANGDPTSGEHLSPLPTDQLQRLSPAALAYLGDAVYELFIRTYFLHPPKRIQRYHQFVVTQVRAEMQAEHLRSLQPFLNEHELALLKRGRNAASRPSRQIDPEIYQQATSLELLIGYLYLASPQRLAQLLSYLELAPNSSNEPSNYHNELFTS